MPPPAVPDGVLAALAAASPGAAIGAEREGRRHHGGPRSCALGAIATGVGLLGAGVILHHGARVRACPPPPPSGRWRPSAPPLASWNVVAKPDRLARSVADLLDIVGRLEAKKGPG